MAGDLSEPGNRHAALGESEAEEVVERRVVAIEPAAAALRERFANDYKQAMRARDVLGVSTSRLLRAAIQELLVARTDTKRKDLGQPLSEADVIGVVEKQIKQREESTEAFTKAGRAERAATEAAEADWLRRYLPEKLSREAIVAVARRLIAELGPDFRKVMPAAAKELKGKADGRQIQEVVRELTQG